MGDVPIGNFLSGGLDSSTIAYYIKDRADINHYTARKNKADLKIEGSSSDYDNAERLSQEWN
jgi:asparagine synthetase B (glutamine-hydrolysing)